MKRLILILSLFVAAPAWSATCKIGEYSNLVVDANGRIVPVAQEPSDDDQSVTYTTSSQSTVLEDETIFIRIICDAKAHFQFGANPTATANDPYVAADTAEYFGVTRGADLKVAFYDGSS